MIMLFRYLQFVTWLMKLLYDTGSTLRYPWQKITELDNYFRHFTKKEMCDIGFLLHQLFPPCSGIICFVSVFHNLLLSFFPLMSVESIDLLCSSIFCIWRIIQKRLFGLHLFIEIDNKGNVQQNLTIPYITCAQAKGNNSKTAYNSIHFIVS